MKIFVVCGKARYGKDEVSSLIGNYYNKRGKKTINLQFSSYIKEYAKNITNWDGSDDTKPRKLLQEIGTDVVRKKIDPLFFIKRIIDDIKVYSYYFDIITISDARVKEEVTGIKKAFDDVCAIKIDRPNFDNGLTLEQRNHYTETDLDDYQGFDYTIINDGDLKDLEEKVEDLMKVIG